MQLSQDTQRISGSAELVEEIPLAISINDIAYAVMMVTPVHLDAFVIGFTRSEGIIEHLSEIRDIDIQLTQTSPDLESIAINLDISPRRFRFNLNKKNKHILVQRVVGYAV